MENKLLKIRFKAIIWTILIVILFIAFLCGVLWAIVNYSRIVFLAIIYSIAIFVLIGAIRAVYLEVFNYIKRKKNV